ncbi:hypothetical protein [Caldimonas tepidiphila]|uniref:hypothetical protein n=1 Tax=Caldimonas tepidiphila TaxID=2315841 RepID=UPI000E5BE7D2|nr:hypothetical protein [Caldimonas tepidiphila]
MEQHRWKFVRAGGVEQVVIRSGADIVNLEQLDQKLWVALACPTHGIEFDPRTLELLDGDKDGRIRPPELIEASRWVREHFRDPDALLAGGDEVPLESINDATEDGQRLVEEARRTLAWLGKADADTIRLDDVRERMRQFDALPFNGDGIVPVEASDDEALRRVLQEIIDTQGGITDRSGRPGIDQARADAFFAQAAALAEWQRRTDCVPGILPLAERTRAAVEAVAAVRDKVEDFFARCRVAAYDARAAAALNPSEEDYEAMASEALRADSQSIAALPLATVAPGRALPLHEGLNPAWVGAIGALRRDAAEPLLGAPLAELHEADWRRLRERLQPCEAWLAEKPGTLLAALEPARLQELLEPALREAVDALIRRDAEVEPQWTQIQALERLVLFQRDLVRLLNNFVSFSDFYHRRTAIFQAGTLYLDARSCDLTVQVNDAGRHAALAGLARTYLAYCDCSRQGEKMSIAAAFTAGDVDFLMVGRNGVFYDRKGRDWDATITKVIENPISIRQAFLAPYKKFLRMLEEMVAKRAAASDAEAQGKLSSLASRWVAPASAPAAPAAGAAAAPAAAAASAGAARRVDVGTVAALGVALGSLSTVAVGVFAKFVELGWWIPVAVLGIVLAISGPSMLIAWLKLRQRSLAPLLDASGWAINGRMRINVPLGASLSETARLPRGADLRLRDPFAERHGGLYAALALGLVIAALGLAWQAGLLDFPRPTSPDPAAAPPGAAAAPRP